MPDIEKVLKGLECCSVKHNCRDCPYGNNTYDPKCMDKMQIDAMVLLKEQDAVAPTLIREARNKNYNDYVCPRCGNEVVYEQNYCSECGVRFLWEGR